MVSKPIILIVGTEYYHEDEEKFNRWYDEIQIPLLLEYKGFKEGTRYKLAYSAKSLMPRLEVEEAEEYPKYLAIYKFENQEAFKTYWTSPEFAAIEQSREIWKERGFKIRWRVPYEPMKTWER